jgi:hypothetical protein
VKQAPSRTAEAPLGAYGLQVQGLDVAPGMLLPACREWPVYTVSAKIGDPPPGEERVTDAEASLNLKTGGRLTMDRRRGHAAFAVPRPLSGTEIVHPFLAPVAAIAAHWSGRLAFHAGGFVAGSHVWGLVGDRGAGKSSMLGWLAAREIPVVADDVLVLDGAVAFAGPRAIDLRADSADRLGAGTALGVVGARARWRAELPAIDAEVPFRGWVFLAWDSELDARRLPASTCLPRLAHNLSLRVPPADARLLLHLAACPAWELRRPKNWDQLDATGEQLLAIAS